MWSRLDRYTSELKDKQNYNIHNTSAFRDNMSAEFGIVVARIVGTTLLRRFLHFGL